jgi:hypothetical protein
MINRLFLPFLILLALSGQSTWAESVEPKWAGGVGATSHLATLSARDRLNAVVQIELGDRTPDADLAIASQAEILWKMAQYEEALALVASLERSNASIGVGIQWMLPIETGSVISDGDKRIGTLSSAEAASIDWDKQSGNLFSVVDWGTNSGWAIYISTDGGSTWSESYLWCCGYELADLAVVDDYVYVAYTVGNEARIRRASVFDGQVDSDFDFQTIVDASLSTPTAINLATNADDADDRIDLSVLLTDGTIRHFWDQAADGTTFSEQSPSVTNASSGLSTSRNVGWPAQTGEYFLVLSYVGADDSINVHRLGNTGWDTGSQVETGMAAAESTSIAAYQDTFLVAYEKQLAKGQGIAYRVSYNGGASWAGATLATPGVNENFYNPLVLARGGTGTAAVYQHETSLENVIYGQQRHNYAPGSWMSRSRVDDYDFQPGSNGFDCNWIDSGWGTVYIDAAGALWFDLSPSIFYSGFERETLAEWSSWQGQACETGIDSDGDRLDDCFETNTNVYVNATNTGTDPNNDDTDGDSIEDGDEVLGTEAGLDLPGMGTNPLRKDVLVEYDWFSDTLGCGLHEHRPTVQMIDRLTAAFDLAPVGNPDGSSGINFIHDFGQGGLFTGGNLIDDADGVLVGGVNGTEYVNHKANNFATNRGGYFHYTMLPHYYNTNSGSSGQAEINGDDLIVSLRCSQFNTTWVSNTIAHELGHNLNLRHGGFENCNYKPNYNSVMNYKYQLNGIDSDCDTDVDGILDYSHGDRITLNENNLDENLGVCGAPPVDWNGSGTIQTGVSHDVNSSGNSTCGGTLTTLLDSNDWARVSFTGILDSDGIPTRQPLEVIDCVNPELVDQANPIGLDR